MLLITKELAEAVIKSHINTFDYLRMCCHCNRFTYDHTEVEHDDNCVVVRAKLLLEKEWGIKS